MISRKFFKGLIADFFIVEQYIYLVIQMYSIQIYFLFLQIFCISEFFVNPTHNLN